MVRGAVLVGLLVGGCVGDSPVVSGTQVEGGTDASPLDASVDTSAPSAVHGSVIDARGQPVASATVRVGTNGGATTTTDAQGSFTITAPGTYDLSVAAPGSKHLLTTYVGLTRRDPQITLTHLIPPPSSVTLSGMFPGSPAKQGSGTYALATVSNSLSFGYADVSVAGAYKIAGAAYAGPPTTSANVFVLSANSSVGEGPYVFGQSMQVGLVNGASFNTINLTSTTPAETSVVGTTNPGGGTIIGYRKQVTISPGVGIAFAYDPAGPSFNTKFPQIGGATFGVIAVVTNVPLTSSAYAFAAGIKPGDPPVTLAIPTPPLLTAPADNAGNVDPTSPLAWTGPKGVTLVDVQCGADGGVSTFTILTSAFNANIPNAADLGVPLPAGGQCTWSIDALTAFATSDDAAAASLSVGSPSMGPGLIARSGADVISKSRSFSLK